MKKQYTLQDVICMKKELRHCRARLLRIKKELAQGDAVVENLLKKGVNIPNTVALQKRRKRQIHELERLHIKAVQRIKHLSQHFETP